MEDQSIRFPVRIVKDVMVRIHDQFGLIDFMVLNMGEEDDDTPIILGDRSSTQPTQSSTSDLDKSTSNSLKKRYAIISIVIPLMNSPRRPALGGDINHPNAERINL